jgi:hypothetical protein
MTEPEADRAQDEVDGWNLSEWDRELPRLRLTFLQAVAMGVALLTAAIALPPNFIRARAQGRLSGCKSNLKNIGTALEMYSTDWSGKYPTTTAMLTPTYLRDIPECPIAGKKTYRAHFGYAALLNTAGYEDYYYVECYGENHTGLSVTGNYPAYNSIQGLIERGP